MPKFLNDISLEQANDLQFKTAAGANAGKIEQDGNNLVLTNPVGDIMLGDGAADVYIGDGTNSVDILFEQSGSIKAEDGTSGVTLTLGSSDTTLAFGGATSFADIVTAFSGTAANTIDVGTSAKPFKDIYAAHHVGGSSINYATSRGWVEDPAPMDQTQIGYFGGGFNRNGSNDENEVVRGLDPFGNKALLWKSILNQSGSNDDGGWNKDIVIPANNNIGYLSYVYFKVDFTADNSNDGQYYLGCGTTSGQTINISNDSSNTNPYFKNGTISTLNNGSAAVANRWYLIIGVIQPYNDESTTNDPISGVYDVETGKKCGDGSGYKMGNNTTGQRHRAYIYYDTSTDNNENAYFWNPGFHAIDGSEPKLQDLLKRQVYLGDNVKAAFGDSDDLEIYHDGSNSYINDVGTGDLLLRRSGGGGLNITGTGVIINGEADINGNADISGNLVLGSYTVASQGNQGIFGKLSSFQNSGSTNLFLGIKNAAYPNRGWSFDPVTNGVNSNLIIKEHGSTAERIKISTGGNFEVLTGSVTATGLDINGSATFDTNVNSGGFNTQTNSNAGSSAYVSRKWKNDESTFAEIWRNSSARSQTGGAVRSFNIYNSHDTNIWSGGTRALHLDTSQNATFAGTINAGAINNTGDITITNGNIIFSSQYGVRFNDANTRIYTNTDSPEDLIIEADQDLLITPDGQVRITGNTDISGALTLGTSLAVAEGGTGATTSTSWLNSNAFANFASSSADWDTLKTRGLYRFTGGTNNPFGTSHATGFTLTESTGHYGFQLASKGSSNNQKYLAYRYRGTSWEDWQYLVTETYGDGRYATAAQGTLATNALPKAGGIMTGNLSLEYAYPRINLTDTNHNSDYSIINNDGAFSIYDVSNTSHRLSISSSGNATFAGDVNVGDDLNIAGNELTFTNDDASAYIRGADALIIESDHDNDDGSSKPIYFYTNGTEMAKMEATVATFAGEIKGSEITFDKTNSAGGGDFDFIEMGYNGSWSQNTGGLAAISVNDGSGVIGRYGVTYGANGGRFVITDLYDGGYGASGDVFEIRGNGAATFAGTIGSGAITSTGKIQGTELEGTSLDINGNADISGNLAIGGSVTSNTTFTADVYVHHNDGLQIGDTGNSSSARTTLTSFNSSGNSQMKIKGGNYVHRVNFETSWNNFNYAYLNSSYNTSDSSFVLNKSASDGSVDSTTTISTGTSTFAGDVTAGSNSLTAGSLDINGNADISGNLVIAGTVDGVDISGLPTSFAPTNAEANVAPTTDQVKTALNNAIGSNELTIGNSNTTTTVPGNIIVTGVTTMSGGTVVNTTTNTAIKDTTIVLNTGIGDSAPNAADIGLIFDRGNLGNTFMGWDESEDEFIFAKTSTEGSTDVSTATGGGIAIANEDAYLAVKAGLFEAVGNILVGGTVDGVDISARDSVLSSTTTTAGAALPKAGGTMTGDIKLNDNVEVEFGTGSDVKMKFDGADLVTTVPTGSSFLIGTNGGTPNDNGGNADFVVDVNASPQISFYSNQVQIGGTNMNWNAYLRYDGSTKLGAWDNDIHIFQQGSSSNSARNIHIKPQAAGGTTTTVATFNGDTGTTLTGQLAVSGVTTIGPGTTGSPYDATTFLHVKGTTRSIVQQSSTADAYYMFGDAGANNAAWVGYDHSSGNLSLQSQTSVTINKNTNISGSVTATSLDINGNADISGKLVLPQTSTTIGTANLANASLLVGSTSSGIGIDNNEIVANGQNLNISTIGSNYIKFRTGATEVLTLDASQNATFAGTVGSGAITSTGKITGTELEGTSLDINGSGDISGGLSGNSSYQTGTVSVAQPILSKFLLAHSTESNSAAVHPYFFNDLANFVNRGGTVTYGGLSADPSANETSRMFMASATTCNASNSEITGSTWTIELKDFPRSLTYGTRFGISFGSISFSPSSMVIEYSTDNGSNYTTALTSSVRSEYYHTFIGNGGTGINAVKFTLGKYTGADPRVMNIYAYNYDSRGMTEYFLDKAGGALYGNLSMHSSGFTLDGNTITGIDNDSEFTSNDNHIMTSLAIANKIADNDNNYLTSSSTQSKYLRSDEHDATGFTITSSNGLGFKVDSAASGRIEIESNNNWSYLRLKDNSAVSWDIASYDGGSLEWRPAGSATNRMTYSSGGVLTVPTLSVTDYGLASADIPNNAADTTGNAGSVTNGVYTTGDQSIAGKKTFTGPTKLEQTLFYDMSAGSLNTTGFACAGLSSGSNGSSATFVFECGGGAGNSYQRIVYNCWSVQGTWNTSKGVDEGGNKFDVTASANGSTITFTFKSRSGTQNYTPRVHVQAMGQSIVTTY